MFNDKTKLKKILIIAGDFLPYSPSLGGVIRILTLADFLRKNNFEVHIIASKSIDFGYFGYENFLKDFKISYINNILQAYIFRNVKEKKSKLDLIADENKSFKTFLNKIKSPLKLKLRKIVYFFTIPDINIFVVNKFYKKSKQIIQNEKIQNIIISSPPHSLQLTGYKLKNYFKEQINLITDYRDSWRNISSMNKESKIASFFSNNYEKKILLSSDYFTFVSTPILAKVEKKYKIDIKYKSNLVMNGFVEEIEIDKNSIETKNNDKTRIGYFGTISDSINSTRNISNILKTIKDSKTDLSFLELHFYGDVTISNFNLTDIQTVFVHKSLSHKEALHEMMKMDYLLIVHSDKKTSDEVITGKFFEYVSARKIIFCAGPEDMEAKRLIDKYNVGINADIDNFSDLKEKLMSLKNLDKNRFYNNLDITIFKRDVQYQTFLRFLK